MSEIKQMDESEDIMHLPISWEEKGKKKGILEGKQEGKLEVAIEMLKEGSTIEFVAKVTQIDRKEIEALSKKL